MIVPRFSSINNLYIKFFQTCSILVSVGIASSNCTGKRVASSGGNHSNSFSPNQTIRSGRFISLLAVDSTLCIFCIIHHKKHQRYIPSHNFEEINRLPCTNLSASWCSCATFSRLAFSSFVNVLFSPND